MAPNNQSSRREDVNALLIKVITGMVSATFTIMIILFSNIYSKIDAINEKMQTKFEKDATSVALLSQNTNSISDLQDAVENIQKDMLEFEHLYGILPEKIRIKNSHQ